MEISGTFSNTKENLAVDLPSNYSWLRLALSVFIYAGK